MKIIKSTKMLVIMLTVAALALTATTLAAVTVNNQLTSTGSITTSPNVGVYADSACTSPISTINWGSVAAGTATSQTVYIKNTGTGSMTLSLATSNWSPTGAGTYITISWNQAGTQLAAGQVVTASITLTVSSSITGISSYSNTITISGTG